jgi:hypothetical protein
VPHVLLDGSLADMNTQFQQFTAYPLSSPESILRRHFPDQGDGFYGYSRFVSIRFRSPLPEQAEELTMPTRASFPVERGRVLASMPEQPLLRAQGEFDPSWCMLAVSPAAGG